MKTDTQKFFEAAGIDLSSEKTQTLIEELNKEELKQKVEKHFGTPLSGPHHSANFGGEKAKIFTFKDKDGRFFNIAVPANEQDSSDGTQYYVQRKQTDANGEHWVSVNQVDKTNDEQNLKIEPTYRLPQGGKELITAFFKSIGHWDN